CGMTSDFFGRVQRAIRTKHSLIIAAFIPQPYRIAVRRTRCLNAAVDLSQRIHQHWILGQVVTPTDKLDHVVDDSLRRANKMRSMRALIRIRILLYEIPWLPQNVGPRNKHIVELCGPANGAAQPDRLTPAIV